MEKHRKEAGFSLAALIFFATAASIVAAAAVPAYQMQAKREREKELIFRGQEYTRAIQKYQRKFGTYPSSIDQLLQTNGLHFLRRAYKDPITGKDFRLIRINPDGSLNGSKLSAQNLNNQPLFGNTQTFGQPQSPPQTGTQQQGQQPGFQQPVPSQFGQQQAPPTPQQSQPPSSSQQFGQFGQAQSPSSPQQFGQFGQAQSPSSPQQFGQPQAQQGGPGSFAPIGNPGTTPISGGTLGTTPITGAGLVGVASNSDEKSVMIYNQRQKYSEWEFLALTGQAGPGGVPQAPVQVPGGQTQANPFSGSNPSAPFGSQPGATPFGSAPGAQPGATPFGPGQGTQPGATPFGPGPGAQPNQQPFTPPNPGMPSNPFAPTPG